MLQKHYVLVRFCPGLRKMQEHERYIKNKWENLYCDVGLSMHQLFVHANQMLDEQLERTDAKKTKFGAFAALAFLLYRSKSHHNDHGNAGGKNNYCIRNENCIYSRETRETFSTMNKIRSTLSQVTRLIMV